MELFNGERDINHFTFPSAISHLPLAAAARSGHGGSTGAAAGARAFGWAAGAAIGTSSRWRLGDGRGSAASRRRARGRASAVRRWRTVRRGRAVRRALRLWTRLIHRAPVISARHGVAFRRCGVLGPHPIAIVAAINRQVAAPARIAASRRGDRVAAAHGGNDALRPGAFDGAVLRLIHRGILRARDRTADFTAPGLPGRGGFDTAIGTHHRPRWSGSFAKRFVAHDGARWRNGPVPLNGARPAVGEQR